MIIIKKISANEGTRTLNPFQAFGLKPKVYTNSTTLAQKSKKGFTSPYDD